MPASGRNIVKWYKTSAVLALAGLLWLPAAGTSEAGTELTVSAALSLKAPMEDIGKAFEKKYPGMRVSFNFAASGALQKQIEAGAPADVFASASTKEIEALAALKLLLPGTRTDFAGNEVVLIAPVKTRHKIRSFSDLGKRETQRIAIGNPASVPAGRYAKESLQHLGLWDIVKDRIVYAEHVRQVMDYVARGEVEAGMVFKTDAVVRSGEVGIIAEAPASSHRPAVYSMAVIMNTQKEKTAKDLISLVSSMEGMEILKRYGFTVRDRAR